MTHDSPGSSPSALSWTVNPVAFEHLPSDAHRGCELQLSLLHNIFSSVETDAYRSWHVRVYYDALKSGCPLIVFNDVPVKTDFYFRLQPFDCMADLLASLLTDGYDLTSLQPFLRT